MRRILIITFASVCLWLTLAIPAMAAQTVKLYIDGVKVPTEQNNDTGYYMDVQPELKDGGTYMPLEVVSNYLTEDVLWTTTDAYINSKDTKLTLTLGSKTAVRNDTKVILAAAPYAKGGRAMMPTRFIAESLGYRVGYINGKVYIYTEPLVIDGQTIKSAQNRIRMTMGGAIYECRANVCIKKLYRLLLAEQGEQISTPEHYGEHINLDTLDYYYMINEISFMAVPGVDGTINRQFRIYNRTHSYQQLTELGFTGPDLGDWLIHDVTHNKWYKVTSGHFYQSLTYAKNTGDWQEIFNNIV